MEVAAQVAQFHERRQLTVPRRFQLTEVLAQLRRDVLVAEELVDLLLAAGLEDLARLDVLDAVLGDGQPAPNGVLAQGDVVVLRAGEVLEQVAVEARRNDTQIEAQAVVRDDRRLRLASGGDLLDPAELGEVLGQLAGLGRRRDDVEIAKRLLAPADAAGLGDLQRRRMLTEHGDDGLNRG